MEILFNHAFTRVLVYPKKRYNGSYLFIKKNYKNLFRWKLWIFQEYEKIDYAVLTTWPERFVCSVEDYESNEKYIENNVIYYKPHCTIIMNDKSARSVIFDTPEELENYVSELKGGIPHLVIEE